MKYLWPLIACFILIGCSDKNSGDSTGPVNESHDLSLSFDNIQGSFYGLLSVTRNFDTDSATVTETKINITISNETYSYQTMMFPSCGRGSGILAIDSTDITFQWTSGAGSLCEVDPVTYLHGCFRAALSDTGLTLAEEEYFIGVRRELNLRRIDLP